MQGAPNWREIKMRAVGYRCNYASYQIETTILDNLGVSFQHVTDCALIDNLEEVVALFVRQETIGRSILDLFPNLKIVQRYGVGVDNVDVEYANQRGIAVCNTPHYGQQYEVSNHAVALYLAISRRLLTRDNDVREGKWDIGQDEPIVGCRNAVLGLIGFGQIARETAKRFRSLGFGTVLVVDPVLTQSEAEKSNIEIVPIEELFTRSDVISLHAPLNASTRHMVGAALLSKAKPSAFLINVSRGGLVDEKALSRALKAGQLSGAGIDVFETEPPDITSELFDAPNTILTDHVAWYSEAAVACLQTAAAEQVARVLTNDPAN